MKKDITWDDIEFFKKEEFSCKHCGENQIELDFVKLLDEVRYKVGKPLIVSSGYRCPVHNNNVSSSGYDGPHTTGRAADILCSGELARDVLKLTQSRFAGLGINQKGEHSQRFIHVDQLEYRVWTY